MLSRKLIFLIQLLLPVSAGNRRCKWEMNQDWLVDLVSLSELQIQLFRGLLVVRTVEHHDTIGAAPGLKTCRAQAEIPDLQLVRGNVLALLLFF
jgi:hypothetical protein